MNFYLDPFLTELCDHAGFREVYLDLLCNSCYYGDATEYNRKLDVPPNATFVEVYVRLGPLVQNFFCNSVNGFLSECRELLTFIQLFAYVPQKYYTTRRKAVTLNKRDYSDMLSFYEELWGSDESIDYKGQMDHEVLNAIIRDITFRLNNGENQDKANFGVTNRFYANTFYHHILLHIKQCVTPGNFHPDFINYNVQFWNQQQKHTELPYSILSVLPREQYAGRNVAIVGKRHSELVKKYETLGLPESDHKMVVNQVLILSGFQSQIFIDLFKNTLDGRDGPNRVCQNIFDTFENICTRTMILHKDQKQDDFMLPEYIYDFVMDKLLKMTGKIETTPTEEGELKETLGMFEDYTKHELIQKKAQTSLTDSVINSLSSPVFIILLLVILCFIFFV